jgi:putative SOS response-associated peptidase YedK
MCGRYALSSSVEQLVELFKLARFVAFDPRYNLAPTDLAPVVRARDGERSLDVLRWGLIPFWAKDPSIGSRMINARAETARTKPAFRDAYERRRCIVPADAFYEWKKEADGKQPYCIRRADGAPMAFAGLWSSWRPSDDAEKVRTFAILTTRPNETVATLHDRMPAILEPEAFAAWLDPDADPEALAELLGPAADGVLDMYPVSRRVNSVRNDDPSCITPVELPSTGGEQGTLFS